MEVSWKDCLALPDIVERYPPVHGMPTPMPGSAHYFTAVIAEESEAVKQHFVDVFAIEYGACLAAGLAAEKHQYGRE